MNSWADAKKKRPAPPRNGDSPAARDSASGRVLAKRWTLTKTLGVGGTGTVYEAVHRNGRRVAVKVLHPEFSHHPTIRKRFSSEGYAANRVQHPDAVAVLDDGEEADGTAFLVMELLEGRSLARVLSERGALPVAEVVAAALSTLEVLAAAHDNGVIHRDVKPANIFATVDGKIKLLDFGVAQVADLASSVVTQTGGTVGTPAFMAPEQAAGRVQEIDALTDIWAVGATMFQLLTQRLVHNVSSSNGTIVAAATVPAPLVRLLAPNVPVGVAEVIDRALAFNRLERWPNARAMHRALRDACPEIAQVTFVESPGQDTEPEPESAPRKRPRIHARLEPRLGMLVLLPLLLVALSAWALRKEPRSGEPSSRAAESVVSRADAPATLPPQVKVIPSASTTSQPVAALPSASASASGKAMPRVSSLPRGPSPRLNAPVSLPTSEPTDAALLDRRK